MTIEHLARRFKVPDKDLDDRKALYQDVYEVVHAGCPKHIERLQRLKGVICDIPIRARLESYFDHLGVEMEPGAASRMVKLRNDLAHGAHVDAAVLQAVELETRLAAWAILKAEAALRGFAVPDNS